jgi:DNA-binding transcriptional regulator YhcF (GntR family)
MKQPLDVQALPGRQSRGEHPPHDPKYVAICKDLRARITSGEYVAGRRLPSQFALAAAYGVSVMTLRQALAALSEEGLVETTHGRGTFVAARPFEYRLNHLSSFAQDMRRQGKFVTTRVLFAGLVAEAEPEICARLALPPASWIASGLSTACRSYSSEAISPPRSVADSKRRALKPNLCMTCCEPNCTSMLYEL